MSGYIATTEDFEKLDIRVGRVIDSESGMKKSLVKLTPNYEGNQVIGRLMRRHRRSVLLRLCMDVPIGERRY